MRSEVKWSEAIAHLISFLDKHFRWRSVVIVAIFDFCCCSCRCCFRLLVLLLLSSSFHVIVWFVCSPFQPFSLSQCIFLFCYMRHASCEQCGAVCMDEAPHGIGQVYYQTPPLPPPWHLHRHHFHQPKQFPKFPKQKANKLQYLPPFNDLTGVKHDRWFVFVLCRGVLARSITFEFRLRTVICERLHESSCNRSKLQFGVGRDSHVKMAWHTWSNVNQSMFVYLFCLFLLSHVCLSWCSMLT